ncbi:MULTISPECIES: hypothetical protein [Nocardiopsis]|uniref:Uncharacterized protein n=1 Tax=Nocardiopsis dassonvillei (strain ATCC 23218 / DSM 43111 / CIP 107115 / JCM 7437 / KCTC 9190 / NBRC 14626 / NCTC 10488 / NRRL B-5397 / IMRU 509) TaxID=446468 RepID=D7AUM6_NOCDD|nr:hypothetical protein [Nocardiopsis dassonvillei]ADH67606.1 conserved hypothetical protein [Nocardiopsis dassonvillei subsp. dassonvillei DSM 43111]APC35792.1 hypothetical protein A9R04_14360 [Nocardiopsis dassonvillei]NKY77556.1 hypothetical protein [Nocardiopsis dassonvillei]VEI87964.1 Uncharacterised protein [Nocardiopsis dassonvillei]
MSPKKRKRRKAQRPDTAPHQQESAPEPGPLPPTAGVSRTPVVLTDPPDRRLTALWAVLALVWLLGTPLALANLLFVFMDLQESVINAAPDAPVPPESLDPVGNALIWVLVLALAVPAASAVAALVLRRRIAAIGFTAALLVSALPLLWVMPPAELWDALTAHLFG